MMPGSMKGRDLRRDGRFALHNATVDKEVSRGDVKINGVAIPAEEKIPGIPKNAEVFRAHLVRVSSLRVAGDHLEIETWRPGQPVTRRERR